MTKYLICLSVILCFVSGCAKPLILLSPEDLYGLGNYYFEEGKYSHAGDQFEIIREKYPTSDFGTMSQYNLGMSKLKQEKFSDAAIEFELFIEFHPAHKLAPQALFQLAMCKYESMLTPDRDATIAHEAMLAFDRFLARYPSHPDAEIAQSYRKKVNDHLLAHDLEAGLLYYRRRAYDSALSRIQPVGNAADNKNLALKAQYYTARCLVEIDKMEEAKELYTKISTMDFQSKYVKKARKQLAKLP